MTKKELLYLSTIPGLGAVLENALMGEPMARDILQEMSDGLTSLKKSRRHSIARWRSSLVKYLSQWHPTDAPPKTRCVTPCILPNYVAWAQEWSENEWFTDKLRFGDFHEKLNKTKTRALICFVVSERGLHRIHTSHKYMYESPMWSPLGPEFGTWAGMSDFLNETGFRKPAPHELEGQLGIGVPNLP